MKKRITLSVLALAVSLTLACSAVFAWYAYSESLISLEFKAGKVDLTVDFYKGIDFDYDGVLDPIDNPYSDLGRDIKELNIKEVYPSRVYTYKLTLNNMSDVESAITILWNFGESDTCREIFSVQTTIVENSTLEKSENPKIFLAGKSSVVAAEEFAVAVGGTYDVIFKVTCETRDTLKDAAATADEDIKSALLAAADNFNNYISKEFVLSDIIIRIQTQN